MRHAGVRIMNNKTIEGKLVVITDASSGLGESTARLLSAEGRAQVLCWMHGESIASGHYQTS
jgi:NADP-dependent 3-hydroxy acid dehydrogenase YdfG